MTPDLRGRRIVNTRAVQQAGAFDALIRARGAVPLAYPCIAIVPPADTAPLDAALLGLATGAFDWLVLTSANTVYSLAQRLDALDLTLDDSRRFRTAAVGEATAQAAQDWLKLPVDLMPDDYVAEALAAALLAAVDAGVGRRVLLPESAIARPTLAQLLTDGGAAVTVVDAYRTVRGAGGVDLAGLLRQGAVDVVTFTSSSTVTYCVERLAAEGGDITGLAAVCLACIGPKTAQTAADHGLTVTVIPDTYTLEGMLDALAQYWTMKSG
ncbi:MAG: uroporphyrinogen-III synthase [Chloroflexota bacterium]